VRRRRNRPGAWARAAVVLALVGHTFGALGCPLPARRANGSGQPYPCQNRSCGCLSASECWAGDCCCFTLEQKLAWAEENGVEPPAHARRLADARRDRPPPAPKSCCRPEGDEEAPEAGCPCCAASGASPEQPRARWVVGVMAQKCRGEGPAGAVRFDPAVVPEPDAYGPPAVLVSRVPELARRPRWVPSLPPTPPPRPN
jgi:hypothetical protein